MSSCRGSVVTGGDEAARRHGLPPGSVDKLKEQRAGPPVFEVIVELRRGALDEWRIVSDAGDASLVQHKLAKAGGTFLQQIPCPFRIRVRSKRVRPQSVDQIPAFKGRHQFASQRIHDLKSGLDLFGS